MFNKKDSKIIPDPWQLPSPKTNINPSVTVEKTTQKLQQKIVGAGNPVAKRLPEFPEKSATVLLRDWLKLKVEEADRLAIGTVRALGLLYWLEMG